MARSKETSSKKDKEKKRVLKNKEKEQKKEDRKAQSKKGQGLEEMMAYVDEFGNLTSTPPDPRNKQKINSEDILIAVPKQVEPDPEDLIRKGTVTHFNHSKGYGFIRDSESQQSVFVHINQMEEAIQETDKVTFEIEMGPKGANAIKVKLIKA
jgi:cold shock CspA family protein